jgi:hypothetical protein
MDEGWIRSILDKRSISYGQITDKEVREGLFTYSLMRGVTHVYPVIILPDQPPNTILNGYRTGSMPEALTGGLGQEGVRSLRQFVINGGTLVCLNRASEFAVEQFKLPLVNVVKGLPRTQFYVPGSILRLEVDTAHPLAQGMPRESIAWAEESPVFEITSNPDNAVQTANAKVVAWYPKDQDPLLSGWLLGGERIKGKAALVEVKMGNGRIVLFSFRPQYRAQSLATYPLFFNSIANK